ncbi:MAG: YicC family protein, partial [Candidatus Omnitrophica bacterium]|nr:YicC family protein [Candidatus Omnitrophota bacterium]
MLTSMTGFGRGEASLPSVGRAVVEIQTLNHRFLEVECRLPEGFQSFEEQVRAMAAGALRRGRARISVALRVEGAGARPAFQTAVARQYLGQLKRLKRELGLPGSVSLEMILGLPQVISVPQQDRLPADWWPALKGALAKALAQVVRMRRKEGAHLAEEMTRLLGTLQSLAGKIRRRLPALRAGLKKRMARRIQALATMGKSGQGAVAAEAASLVQGMDVSEELARIDSHLIHLRQAISGRLESAGRTVDFLAQELQREVNTLGTKAREAQVIGWVVAMKNEIEKLREQSANV